MFLNQQILKIKLQTFLRYFLAIFMLVFFVSNLYLTTLYTSHAQGGQTDFIESCPVDSVSPDCNPPTFQQIEYMFVRLIYFLWISGGIIFGFFLAYAGWMYFSSLGEQDKMAEARDRASKWLISVLLYFFSRPIVATMMHEFVSDNVNCYAELNEPGFTFFFPTACTSGVGNENTTFLSCSETAAFTDNSSSLSYNDYCAQTLCPAGLSGKTEEIGLTVVYDYKLICLCAGETTKCVEASKTYKPSP